MTLKKLSEVIGNIMSKKGITLSTCESCTGGLLGSIITVTPGSSHYFRGGVTAYSNAVKTAIVGVRHATLKRYGAVSRQVAYEMAQKIKKRLKSDIGVSVTGIAGPGGATKHKPVGLVFIGFSGKKETRVEKYQFRGDREQIRIKACRTVLTILKDELT